VRIAARAVEDNADFYLQVKQEDGRLFGNWAAVEGADQAILSPRWRGTRRPAG